MLKIKLITKKSVFGYVYLPQEWGYEVPKIDMFEIKCTEIRKKIHFRAQRCHKYVCQKMIMRIKFPAKNLVGAYISISPEGGVRGFQRLICLNYYHVLK